MNGSIKALACACALVVSLGLAACGSSAPSASSTAADSASSAQAATQESTSAPAESASAESASAEAASAASSDAQSSSASASHEALAPGVYTAEFNTDSNMFHVNEAYDGKGQLTVANDGSMTIHISLVSKKIEKLYLGKAEQAEADVAGALNPTTDKVTYSDGYEKEVYGFDVPVPALDEEFDVAILGSKGTWYDHVVTVSNPVAE